MENNIIIVYLTQNVIDEKRRVFRLLYDLYSFFYTLLEQISVE